MNKTCCKLINQWLTWTESDIVGENQYSGKHTSGAEERFLGTETINFFSNVASGSETQMCVCFFKACTRMIGFCISHFVISSV